MQRRALTPCTPSTLASVCSVLQGPGQCPTNTMHGLLPPTGLPGWERLPGRPGQ